MKLDVRERFIVLGLLPADGKMLAMKCAENIRASVGFTEKELEPLKVTHETVGEPPNQMVMQNWDPKAATAIGEREFELSKPQTKLLTDRLVALEEADQIRAGHLSLCEKLGLLDE